MEQHPVPRNVSGFQFRLIGDMTIKQFAYLAVCSIFAIIIFRLPAVPALFTYPIGGLIAFLGVALAFIPIQERPLDRWLIAFIRSIYSPTQFLWIKNNQPPDILLVKIITTTKAADNLQTQKLHEDSKRKLEAYLATLPTSTHVSLDQNEQKKIQGALSLFDKVSYQMTGTAPPAPAPKPLPFEPKPPAPNSFTFAPIQPRLQPTQPVRNFTDQQPLNKAQEDIKKKLEALALENQRLAEEVMRLKKTGAGSASPPPRAPVQEQYQLVPDPASEPGLPKLSPYPNLVSGLIKNRAGKLVPGVIVTIKDQNGAPVRALKTNRLGQFAASTQLASGGYRLEIEDPQKQYVFDIIEISLTGIPFPPILIWANGEKELMREKLSKELFGKGF